VPALLINLETTKLNVIDWRFLLFYGSISMARSASRWRSFRQQHRHHPLKQALYLSVMLLLVAIYSYSFFHLQPDRSDEHVAATNAALTEQVKKKVAKRAQQKKNNTDEDNEAESVIETTAISAEMTAPGVNATDSPNARRGSDGAPKPPRDLGFVDNMIIYLVFWFVFRTYLRICVYPRIMDSRAGRRQSRQQLEDRQNRFQTWVQTLNRQREENGQRPLSMESLRLVLRDRELNGEDYDGLLQFDEEAGPAMQELLSNMGATQEEINRCPARVLREATDDLLSSSSGTPHCAICLEPYEMGQSVRTIPCFHTFHVDCIDPWLSTKASCPVCKHPAVA
jgi:hypothetical protein